MNEECKLAGAMLSLYNSLVGPLLKNALQFFYKNDTALLQRVQRRATKMLPSLWERLEELDTDFQVPV